MDILSPEVVMSPVFGYMNEGPAVAPGPALSWFSRGAARAGVPLSERDPSQRASVAGELYVSVNTVRTHMRHLYDKLGAHRRLEAIDRARALGLLAPAPQRA